MKRFRAALWGIIMCIWIGTLAACSGQNTAAPAPSAETKGEIGESSGTETEDVSEDAEGETAGELSLEEVLCYADVTLEGGSGKASVESPCPVFGREGSLAVLITWSSSHYDYMVVDGEKILPVNTEGNSQFEVPLGIAVEEVSGLPADCALKVQADTTAMSTPHLIDYTLSFSFRGTREDAGKESSGEEEASAGETAGEEAAVTDISGEEIPVLPGLPFREKEENEYAECYAIYRYEGGYAVLSVDDGRRYLIIPEGKEVPAEMSAGGDGGLIPLQQPLDRIYLAASAAMCQFDEIGAVQNVILSGLPEDGWYIESAKKAMEDGTLEYGGRYSAPDYEKIVASEVDLAVESTMILHTPKVQEKLEKLGIPVLIDRSSYESEPLGRAEWVKVYGLLTGREEEAEQAFAEQRGYVEALSENAGEGQAPVRSVAIFSVNSTRQVVTRSSGDYFGRMLEIAGGELCTPVTDSSKATQTVSMESFYAAARDADILIYNASIEDAPENLEQMCAKDNILTQFRAVSEGNVWCMRSSLYQNASRTGAVIRDLNAVVTGSAGDETEFFYRLK